MSDKMELLHFSFLWISNILWFTQSKFLQISAESEYEIVNDTGNMGYEFPITAHMTHGENRKLWELNYQEAAIFLQEGENNDKFYTHPRSCNALPAYQIAHHQWFKVLDLIAALGLLLLAVSERPAVPYLTLPVGVSMCFLRLCCAIKITQDWKNIKGTWLFIIPFGRFFQKIFHNPMSFFLETMWLL